MNSLPSKSPEIGAPRPVTLAVLTYERDDSLRRAVRSMLACAVPEAGANWMLHEVLIVDNNPTGSAKPAVEQLASETDTMVTYTHEPSPGIVAARNRALTKAGGEVLVFIDDDEIALPGWPDGLLKTMDQTGAALVGGPVVSEFIEEPPKWVLESGHFVRPPRANGSEPSWLATGNLAIDLTKTRPENLWFDTRYPHGEDATFSRLAASRGLGLRWSATASVKEYVQPERMTVAWRCDRHRISTNAWVRADLDLDPSLRTKATVLGKTAYRLAQGVLKTGIGILTKSKATRYSGLALIAQARGGLEGLITHSRSRQANVLTPG